MKKIKTKEYILRELARKGEVRTGDISRALSISRQTAAQHMRELAQQRKVTRLGSTIDSRYVPYVDPSKGKEGRLVRVGFIRALKGLHEDRVFAQIDIALGLKKSLSDDAYRICGYVFSEMLNNAIDHSKAKTAVIDFRLSSGNAEFWVKDKGIGAFESVRKRFNLQDHYEAVEHLMKGKQTTDPKRHSGQGIFFSSRAADFFCIESAGLKWVVDNRIQDVTLQKIKPFKKGTEIYFCIKQRSRRELKAIFDQYTNDDFEFDKTEVRVRLSKKQGEYVSRSEAKRILFGLDKFKRIIFDYKGVSSIGQSFADEIYRVFQGQYPGIHIETLYANEPVQFMVRRAIQKPVN